jgi:hypothetical protein
MASSVTVTETNSKDLSVKRVKFAWTAHTDGVVTGVATTGYYTGKIERLVTDPDGVTAPTALYDITIVDDDGYDVLAGAGADRSATVTEQVLASSLGVVVASKLTFAASAAGSGGKGVAWVYLR